MKSKFGREIVLLTLPVLLIGGVAFWNGKVKSWSGFGAPRGLYEGKPRLEITDWNPETPSALDFARGISSRWKVTTWQGGACPGSGVRPLVAASNFPRNLHFAWKRKGKWQRTPSLDVHSGLKIYFGGWDRKRNRFETHLALPLDLVPHNAQEVRLRGRLEGNAGCPSGVIAVSSAPIDKVLKASGEAWPQFAGSHVPGLKLREVQQQWSESYRSSAGTSYYWDVRATFSGLKSDKPLNIYAERSQVTDASGKLHVGGWFERSGPEREGTKTIEWSINVDQLKGHQGPFHIESWVFAREGELPLRVSIPLKLKRPSK